MTSSYPTTIPCFPPPPRGWHKHRVECGEKERWRGQRDRIFIFFPTFFSVLGTFHARTPSPACIVPNCTTVSYFVSGEGGFCLLSGEGGDGTVSRGQWGVHTIIVMGPGTRVYGACVGGGRRWSFSRDFGEWVKWLDWEGAECCTNENSCTFDEGRGGAQLCATALSRYPHLLE